MSPNRTRHITKYATYSDQPIPGLELLLRGLIIVDQSKSSAPSTTKLSLETEGDDTGLVGLVEGSELLREVGLGHIGATRVEDVDNELTAGQKAVGDEFARAQSYGCIGLLKQNQKDDISSLPTPFQTDSQGAGERQA